MSRLNGLPILAPGQVMHPVCALLDDSKGRSLRDRTLTIVVIDESGTEIHREQVHPGEPNFDVALGQIG